MAEQSTNITTGSVSPAIFLTIIAMILTGLGGWVSLNVQVTRNASDIHHVRELLTEKIDGIRTTVNRIDNRARRIAREQREEE